ncbi:unnamed protein product [Closterium sp. NIES-65]|nr:unnamed protein product [Closterium sp. NIES-65]
MGALRSLFLLALVLAATLSLAGVSAAPRRALGKVKGDPPQKPLPPTPFDPKSFPVASNPPSPSGSRKGLMDSTISFDSKAPSRALTRRLAVRKGSADSTFSFDSKDGGSRRSSVDSVSPEQSNGEWIGFSGWTWAGAMSWLTSPLCFPILLVHPSRPELESSGLKQRAVDLLKWGVDWLLMANHERADPGRGCVVVIWVKQRAVDLLKWGVDWLLMADLGRGCVVAQVGDSAAQDSCWQRPEDDSAARPVYTVVGANGPGAAVLADMSAAFAAACSMPALGGRGAMGSDTTDPLATAGEMRITSCLGRMRPTCCGTTHRGHSPHFRSPHLGVKPRICCLAAGRRNAPPFPTPASFPFCDPHFRPSPPSPHQHPIRTRTRRVKPGYAALLQDHATIPNSCYSPPLCPNFRSSHSPPSEPASHVFGEFDPGYAASLRDHATMLFELATTATSTDE